MSGARREGALAPVAPRDAGVEGMVELRFLGSGDASYAGGRAASALYVRAQGGADRVLLDCGPTVPYALQRAGVDPGEVDAVCLTHFHGDHMFGLPFLLLATYGQTPAIAGPRGVGDRIHALVRLAFPGLYERPGWRPREVRELAAHQPPVTLPGTAVRVEAFPMQHRDESLGYRLTWPGGVTVAVTGDTAWTDELLRLAHGVDLLVCECTSLEETRWPHLSWAELRPRLSDLGAGVVVLTHRGRTMQDAPPDLPEGVLLAEDDLLLHVRPAGRGSAAS